MAACGQKQEWFCRRSRGVLGLVSSYPQLLFAPILTSSREAPQVVRCGLPGAAGAGSHGSSAGWGSIGGARVAAQQGPCPQGTALWARPGTPGSWEPRTRVLPSAASSAWLPRQLPGRGKSGNAGSAWTVVPPRRWVGCLAVWLPAEPAWVFLLET